MTHCQFKVSLLLSLSLSFAVFAEEGKQRNLGTGQLVGFISGACIWIVIIGCFIFWDRSDRWHQTIGFLRRLLCLPFNIVEWILLFLQIILCIPKSRRFNIRFWLDPSRSARNKRRFYGVEQVLKKLLVRVPSYDLDASERLRFKTLKGLLGGTVGLQISLIWFGKL
ncbi:hypothetical protein BT69DRAFT_145614 [Atractiella rhizophila]|nr:hypothetical protein BT69DRAFT_145614 [Atractiella rhizophila]